MTRFELSIVWLDSDRSDGVCVITNVDHETGTITLDTGMTDKNTNPPIALSDLIAAANIEPEFKSAATILCRIADLQKSTSSGCGFYPSDVLWDRAARLLDKAYEYEANKAARAPAEQEPESVTVRGASTVNGLPPFAARLTGYGQAFDAAARQFWEAKLVQTKLDDAIYEATKRLSDFYTTQLDNWIAWAVRHTGRMPIVHVDAVEQATWLEPGTGEQLPRTTIQAAWDEPEGLFLGDPFAWELAIEHDDECGGAVRVGFRKLQEHRRQS